MIRDNLACRREREKPDSLVLAANLLNLGSTLLKQSKGLEAEPLIRDCLAIRLKTMPDDWRRFNTNSMLGGALLVEGRYAEAEPLIVEGYEGIKAREAKIPAAGKVYLTEAAERVMQLYRAWGKPAEAAAWSARLGRRELPDEVFAR